MVLGRGLSSSPFIRLVRSTSTTQTRSRQSPISLALRGPRLPFTSAFTSAHTHTQAPLAQFQFHTQSHRLGTHIQSTAQATSSPIVAQVAAAPKLSQREHQRQQPRLSQKEQPIHTKFSGYLRQPNKADIIMDPSYYWPRHNGGNGNGNGNNGWQPINVGMDGLPIPGYMPQQQQFLPASNMTIGFNSMSSAGSQPQVQYQNNNQQHPYPSSLTGPSNENGGMDTDKNLQNDQSSNFDPNSNPAIKPEARATMADHQQQNKSPRLSRKQLRQHRKEYQVQQQPEQLRSNRPGTSKWTPMTPRDPIIPPSAASGGIPDPTPSYLSLSQKPSVLLPYPRRLLVVLDLNGTLLFRPSRHRPKSFSSRPYATEFLHYCINTFHVAIWSSARRENVKSMIQTLLPEREVREKLVVEWSRDEFGLSKDDYWRRVQCYKRLGLIWMEPDVRRSHPLRDGGGEGGLVGGKYGGGGGRKEGIIAWSQLDTVLVDDSAEKARSEPYNLIQIPEFNGGEKPERDPRMLAMFGAGGGGGGGGGAGAGAGNGGDGVGPDGEGEEGKDESQPPREAPVLPQVHDYLNVLSQQSNVSSYMRDNPFKLDPTYSLFRDV
ncbi:phosphoprotein phosphatase [Zalerion maritima]|uniref:Phosphoprotein phosphatase n=1 Tax=Zalerion maritima TaxID=339359 RepID=A0AAD5WSB3_9PEZI|nr:phosphoprotein phosphatase [Zalerion maritima]